MSVTEIACELKIFNILCGKPDKPWTVSDLSTTTGTDPLLLDRLLRYLSTQGLVEEVHESTYTSTHITPHLATPSFFASLKHNALFVNPSFLALPEFLRETNYRNPSDPKHLPLNKALNTDQDLMTYLQENPDKAHWTFQYMAAHKSDLPTWMDGSIPSIIDDLKLSPSDLDKGRTMFVDIGGGAGHQCANLRRAFPELKGKMVVQDVPVMIDMVDKEQAASIDLEHMVHDFWTPQPVKGAKVYYLRTVLHDWQDEACKTILRHLREAMAPDSIVIIDESIMPAKGATARQMHFDLTMMVALGARERTEQQKRELFEVAGLKIRDIWIYDENRQSGLIVGVPAWLSGSEWLLDVMTLHSSK